MSYRRELEKIRKQFPIFDESVKHDCHEIGSENSKEIQQSCVSMGRGRWFEITDALMRETPPDVVLPLTAMTSHPGGRMGYVIGMTIDQLCVVGQPVEIYQDVCRALEFTQTTVPPVLFVREVASQWLGLRSLMLDYCRECRDAVEMLPLLEQIAEFAFSFENSHDVMTLDRETILEFLVGIGHGKGECRDAPAVNPN